MREFGIRNSEFGISDSIDRREWSVAGENSKLRTQNSKLPPSHLTLGSALRPQFRIPNSEFRITQCFQ